MLIALSLDDTRSIGNNRGDDTAKSNGLAQKAYKALIGEHEFVWEQKTK